MSASEKDYLPRVLLRTHAHTHAHAHARAHSSRYEGGRDATHTHTHTQTHTHKHTEIDTKAAVSSPAPATSAPAPTSPIRSETELNGIVLYMYYICIIYGRAGIWATGMEWSGGRVGTKRRTGGGGIYETSSGPHMTNTLAPRPNTESCRHNQQISTLRHANILATPARLLEHTWGLWPMLAYLWCRGRMNCSNPTFIIGLEGGGGP